MSLLERIRWRLALLLAPDIDTARGKRLLERVARECGASKSQAIGIAGRYFRELHRER